MNYRIEGTPLPVVICELTQGEAMRTERGGMSWMSAGIQMSTNMQGGLGKALGRAFGGESMFMSTYTCQVAQGEIAFASSFPGQILAIKLAPGNAGIIAQKRAFLAAEPGVEMSVHFNRKIGGGFFGGEGFIMQRLAGEGMVFLELDGHVIARDLQAGETLYVDTGNVAAMTEGVTLDVEMIKGVKNVFFGGEGLFNTRLTGPGRVWLQTMPASSLARMLAPLLPSGDK